jgi:NHL repeat
MAAIARSVGLVLAIAVLTACSSSGEPALQSAPAQPLASGSHRSDAGRLVFRVRVPRKRKTRRAPRYVSPATAAITIAITGLANVQKTAALGPDAGCSNLCTVSIPGLKPCRSAATCYVATVATYDAVTGCPSACAIPGAAHELSGNQSVPFRIVKARDNLIEVTLDGVPASAVLVPDADATLSGNMASGFTLGKCNSPAQHVSVFALDADGNYILGAGAPILSLASNDAVDLPVTAAPSPASPNGFTLTPPTVAAANKVVQLTIGAAPLAGGSGAPPVTTHVNVTFDDICGLYVSDAGNTALKEIVPVGGTIPAAPTIDTLATGFNSPFGIAVDRFGDVFVADFFVNEVKEVVAVGGSIPPSPTIDILSSSFNRPEGVAVDGSGNVYVADTENNEIKEIVAVGGSIPASPTINTLGSGFSSPSNVAVDASGNVYVADTGNKAVKEMLAVGGSIPASPTINTLGSGFNGPTGVAVDSSGNVFVAQRDSGSVQEIMAVGGSIPPVPVIKTLGSGFGEPVTVAVDGLGNVYVVDYPTFIKEIVAVGGSIPASPTIDILGSGFLEPLGIAVR